MYIFILWPEYQFIHLSGSIHTFYKNNIYLFIWLPQVLGVTRGIFVASFGLSSCDGRDQ